MVLTTAGAQPEVTPVATAALRWQRTDIAVTPQEDIGPLMAAVLPAIAARRDCLLSLRGQGRLGVQQMQDLRRALAQVAPDFMYFAADLTEVQLAHDAADIDAIDASGGALRQAAQRLAARGDDPALSDADRRVAQNALSYLFGFAAGDVGT